MLEIKKVIAKPGAVITDEMVAESRELAKKIGTNEADALMRVLIANGTAHYEGDDEDQESESPDEEDDPGEECGRWRNGRLADHCLKAGSEECDFECPYNK